MWCTDFLAKAYSFFAAFIPPHFRFHRLRAVTILALLLAMASISSSLDLQAQDAGSGQEAVVTRRLIVDTSGARLNPFCLGRQVTIPLVINSEIQVAGEPDAGNIDLPAVNFEVSSSNFAVVSADPATGSPGVSSTAIASSMTLTAVAPGKATITVSANLGTIEFPHQSIEVEVAPCRYKVEVKSLCITTIQGANVFLRINAESEMVINPSTGLFQDQPSFHWDATTNHVKGCWAGHAEYNTLKGNGGSFEGRIKDDQLILTVQMQDLIGGGVLFLPCNRPPPEAREDFSDCSRYPDNMCHPDVINVDFFPDNAPIMDVAFPLDGGTKAIPQRIQFTPGGAGGTVFIKVTPIINK